MKELELQCRVQVRACTRWLLLDLGVPFEFGHFLRIFRLYNRDGFIWGWGGLLSASHSYCFRHLEQVLHSFTHIDVLLHCVSKPTSEGGQYQVQLYCKDARHLTAGFNDKACTKK